MKTLSIFFSFIAVITGLDSGSSSSRGLLVYPRLLEERGSDGSRILKINEDITLNLKKSSVLGEEFLLKSYVGDVEKHTYMDGSYLEEDLFHDADAMASLTLSNNGELQVEGMIGPKLRIMPAHEQERSLEGHAAHMIYEIPDGRFGLHDDAVHPPENYFNLTERAVNVNDIYNAKIIYPELFVLVDTAFFQQFGREETKLIKYVCRTVNAMNLRYLSVSNPQVEFRLLGIEILTTEKERFLQRVQGQPHYIYGPQSLAALREYVKSNAAAYKSYDLVYLITGLDMVINKGYIDSGNMGYAYIAGACSELKVGLGEDTANTFRGVHIMTHEVAHIMGCPHDGDYDPSRLRGQGSSSCPFSEGYIMSYYVINLNYYKFSWCCNNQISSMSWSPLGRCLHEKNARSTMKKTSSKLPGEGHTKSGQCKRAYPRLTTTYYMETMPIVNCEMFCYNPRSASYNEGHYKLKLTDGTKCGNHSKVCINGECRSRRRSYRT
uniref:Putative metalloprotease n=1 Tax=Ixodes ricinus TaxID=34613 RepID=A0A0K8RJS2_IXORI